MPVSEPKQRSLALILVSSTLTKLGDAVASPKTTLAWLATLLGTPPFVLGFLVPIREAGSMIPQLFIGSAIRTLALRKWVWVGGALVQGACIAAIGAVALRLEGRVAGLAVLALIACFSLARAFCSVASKDVLGKCVPKTKRGRLTGGAASAAGLISVALGLLLLRPIEQKLDTSLVAMLLFGAGALWWVASISYGWIPEPRGATDPGRSPIEALRRLELLRSDRPFRRFVTTRALLMCSALSAPFYVALAQSGSGAGLRVLGAFVASAGAAGLVSAPLWGHFSDRSSRRVMVTAALLTAGVGLATVVALRVAPGLGGTAWFLPAAYFVLSVAHSGVRVGRKTYVVNLGSGNTRTDYVAIGNSVIGVLLLVVGSVGALTPLIGNDGVILLLSLMGLAGAGLGTTLPEAEAGGG